MISVIKASDPKQPAWHNLAKLRLSDRVYFHAFGTWCDSAGNVVLHDYLADPDSFVDEINQFDKAYNKPTYDGPNDWQRCRIIMVRDEDEHYTILIRNPAVVKLSDDELNILHVKAIESFDETSGVDPVEYMVGFFMNWKGKGE